VHVKASPIGIDPKRFTTELATPGHVRLSSLLRDTYKDRRLLLGVDRLDYIKGLPLKIQALDQLLSQHPKLIGKAVLVQVVVPSREDLAEYQELLRTLNELADDVNQKYGKTSVRIHVRY
jgi:trehalose-6-phosphate synthase